MNWLLVSNHTFWAFWVFSIGVNLSSAGNCVPFAVSKLPTSLKVKQEGDGDITVSWAHSSDDHVFNVAWTELSHLQAVQVEASLNFFTTPCTQAGVWNITEAPGSSLSACYSTFAQKPPAVLAGTRITHQQQRSIRCSFPKPVKTCLSMNARSNCSIGKLVPNSNYIIEVSLIKTAEGEWSSVNVQCQLLCTLCWWATAKCGKMGPVRIRHRSHYFATQSSHSVDSAGWQAKMPSIES